MKHLHRFLAITVGIILLSFISNSCKKEDDFLNKKPSQSLTEPATLNDIALLLKNEDTFNTNYPGLGEVGTDDIYLDQSTWQNFTDITRNTFVWQKDIYPAGKAVNDWNYPYQIIFTANIALTQLDRIGAGSNPVQFNVLRGAALFFRGVAFYNLMQLFSAPYDATSAGTQLGVPLVLTANLNIKTGRATQAACYQQIIEDLSAAAGLLPDLSVSKTDPSKAGAFSMLSRVYLVMGDYNRAQTAAVAALELNKQLNDFNKLTATRPVFPNFSIEETFHASLFVYSTFGSSAQVNPDLLALFNDPNDLRPGIFFRTVAGKITWNSQTDRRSSTTYATTTAELYLTKAECEARAGNTAAAMDDLNTLLITRWKTGTYKAFTATNQDDALRLILLERRKELVLTCNRWSDLRRLNKEPRFAITLTRTIGTQVYILPPNDARYTLPIPDAEILVNPMPQNPR